MVSLAVANFKFDLEDLVITILRAHEEQFRVTEGLTEAFGRPIRALILEEPTRSQAETVARTLDRLQLQEPFLVRDSDNTFALDGIEQPANYVCVDSLNNHDLINPRNKSYLQTDHKGLVTNIREKVVISDLFSVGGYYFTDPERFLHYYQRLLNASADWQRELYISDVIGSMILDGIPFHARRVDRYEDWGTVHEWKGKLLAKKAFFVSLDGFLFERGSEHFRPRFEDVSPIPKAVEALQALAAKGHALIYLSIRPPELAELTRKHMREAGVPDGPLVCGCPIARWELITAPHPSMPFQTSSALELNTDDPNLLEKILGEG
jgi:hypothetical protein